MFAALEEINKKYNVSIILTSRSIIEFSFEVDKSLERPANPKTLDHWVKSSLKIERTSISGERILLIEKHPRLKHKNISLKLTEKGFE